MKPWFTYLSFQSVHDPLQVSYPYISGLDSVCSSNTGFGTGRVWVFQSSGSKIRLKPERWFGPDKFSFRGLEVPKCISCLDHKFAHGLDLDLLGLIILGFVSAIIPGLLP